VNMTKKSNKQLKAKLAKARVEIKGRFERADVRRQFDVGDIIQFSDGKRYEVLHRNQSRARVRALDRVERNGVNQITNEPFHFSFAKEFDISAGAEAKIVGHTGRKPAPIKRICGFIVRDDVKPNGNGNGNGHRKAVKKMAAKKESKERTGTKARYEVCGFAATAVIRALAKHGMTIDETIAAMTKAAPGISEATIRIQHRAGQKGERGDPAPLTLEQIAELGGKPKKAPARAKAKAKKAIKRKAR